MFCSFVEFNKLRDENVGEPPQQLGPSPVPPPLSPVFERRNTANFNPVIFSEPHYFDPRAQHLSFNLYIYILMNLDRLFLYLL